MSSNNQRLFVSDTILLRAAIIIGFAICCIGNAPGGACLLVLLYIFTS